MRRLVFLPLWSTCLHVAAPHVTLRDRMGSVCVSAWRVFVVHIKFRPRADVSPSDIYDHLSLSSPRLCAVKKI